MNDTARPLTVLTALVIADVFSTLWFRSLGLAESNPLVEPWVDGAMFIVVKVGMVALFALAVLLLHVESLTKWVWAACGIIGAAVIINLVQIWRIQ